MKGLPEVFEQLEGVAGTWDEQKLSGMLGLASWQPVGLGFYWKRKGKDRVVLPSRIIYSDKGTL